VQVKSNVDGRQDGRRWTPSISDDLLKKRPAGVVGHLPASQRHSLWCPSIAVILENEASHIGCGGPQGMVFASESAEQLGAPRSGIGVQKEAKYGEGEKLTGPQTTEK